MDINLLKINRLLLTKNELAPMVLECSISGRIFHLGLDGETTVDLARMCAAAIVRRAELAGLRDASRELKIEN